MGAVEYVSEEDAYECPLSEETQKIAKDELREDKNTRDQALEQVRSWLKLNPRIENSRMGIASFSFLLVRIVIPIYYTYTRGFIIRRPIPAEIPALQKIQRSHVSGGDRAVPAFAPGLPSRFSQSRHQRAKHERAS